MRCNPGVVLITLGACTDRHCGDAGAYLATANARDKRYEVAQDIVAFDTSPEEYFRTHSAAKAFIQYDQGADAKAEYWQSLGFRLLGAEPRRADEFSADVIETVRSACPELWSSNTDVDNLDWAYHISHHVLKDRITTDDVVTILEQLDPGRME